MLKLFCLTLVTLLLVLYWQARRAARDIRRNRAAAMASVSPEVRKDRSQRY